MSKRAVVMASAVALAGGVMVVAYLAGGGSGPGGQADRPGASRRPGGGQATLDPSWPAGDFNPRGQGGRTPPLQAAGATQFTRINERGQLEVYKGDPITPLPDGWWQVGKPEFIYHLADDRVLRLRAEQGRLYAPAEPRSGQLKGQVKLEYFDTDDPARAANVADDSADLRLRMHLHEVTFDRDLFRLETDGPFHLTSPQFDFVGQGLKLVYSDVGRRIETLQVARSQTLRFRAATPPPETPQAPEALGASVSPESSLAVSEGASAQPVAPSSAPAAPAPAASPLAATPEPSRRPVQFYRAVFPVNVRLHSEQATMHCQELEIVFSLQNETGHSRVFQSMSPDQPASPVMLAAMMQAGGPPLQQAMHHLLAWSMAQTPSADDALAQAAQAFAGQSLMPASPDDLTLAWDGVMTVSPVTPSVALAGPQDVYVQMRGRPVRVISQRGETTHAASLSYRLSDGQLTMLGDDAYPVVMQSPQLGGVLEARHFALNQQDAVAQVRGRGVLRAVAQEAADESDAPADAPGDTSGDTLPAGFAVEWQEKLDLTFYPRVQDDAARKAAKTDLGRGAVRLAALRDATFHGDVVVTHPRLEVRSDELAMQLGPPAEVGDAGAGRAAVESLRARGDVRVQVHGQGQDQQEASIASQTLAIHLGQDDRGRLAPQKLVAQQDVVAHTAQGTLKAGKLTAILAAGDDPPARHAISHDAPVAQVVHLAPVPLASPGSAGTATASAAPSADAFDVVLEVAPPTPLAGDVTPGSLAQTAAQAAGGEAQDQDTQGQDAAGDGASSDGLARFVQPVLRQIIAEQGVAVTMAASDASDASVTQVQAQRMVADIGPLETQVDLSSGDRDRPVQVARDGLLITGPRVIFAQQARTLHMPEHGRMEFYSQSPVKLDATGDGPVAGSASLPGAQGASAEAATLVVVTWSGAMHLDDRQGAAQFLGDVKVHGSQGGDASKLACEDLRLEFLPAAARSELDRKAVMADADDDQQLMRGVRQVQRVIARQDVVFEAQTMGKAADLATPAATPESRVRIEGPLMTFDGLTEQVRVIGPGRMSIEDRRERSAKPAGDGSSQPVTAMAGQGATAFVWQGQLILDAARNDMTIQDNVQMIHLPMDRGQAGAAGQGQPFQLDCDTLVADMASTGGLATVGRAGTPQLQAIRADGQVRLLNGGRRVTTDHLHYDGVTEVVRLYADQGQYTTISEAATPVPLTFREVRWFLRDNRFEGIEPGRGVVPLLRNPADRP